MDIFKALDHEWEQTPRRSATKPIPHAWITAAPLLEHFPDQTALLAHFREGGHAEQADRLLAALTALAATDDAAARLVLQALLPGLRRVATELRTLDNPREIDAAVIAHAWQHIRRYPINRRPQHIAANVILDTRKVVLKTQRRRTAESLPDELPGTETHLCPDEELTGVVREAVTDGHLAEDSALLILQTRIGGATLGQVAAANGETADAVRKRRRRAELRLIQNGRGAA